MSTATETAQFESRWEEYKGTAIKEIWKATGPIAGCSVTIIIVAIVGEILGWKTLAFVGLGFVGLVWFAQKAKFTVPGVILDITMMIAMAGALVYTIYTKEQRDGRATVVFAVLIILYELYLFNRAGQQIMFRRSRIQTRVIESVCYPLLPNGHAFEWFVEKEGRGGALVPRAKWPSFAQDMLPGIRHTARFFCEACGMALEVADANKELPPCGICSRPGQVVIICEKPPESAASERDLAEAQVGKVPCSNCGHLILESTSTKYKGLCRPCWEKGY